MTPLGPRATVEAAAREDIGPHIRPRLYIVDGDLDLLARGRSERISNLYRLSVYSVENLLIDVDAIKKYCRFACPALDEQTCFQQCAVEDLFFDMQRHLPAYLSALAIARRLNLAGRVSAINPPSIGREVRGRRIGPCPNLIRSRLREIVQEAISTRGPAKYLQAKRVVRKNLKAKNANPATLAPGKLFTLAYVNERISLSGGMTLPQKAMVSYLAEHAHLQNDRGFRATLRRKAKDL